MNAIIVCAGVMILLAAIGFYFRVQLRGRRPGEPSPLEPLRAFDPASTDLRTEVLQTLQSGGKITAIKRYRQRTGVGLREAKDAVEQIESGGNPAVHTQAGLRDVPQCSSDDDLQELIRRGRTIEAIKRYRERTGAGLREARDAILDMQRRQA